MAWTCEKCTLINKPGAHECGACQTCRLRDPVEEVVAVHSLIDWKCRRCTYENKQDGQKCEMCGFEQSSDSLVDTIVHQLALGIVNETVPIYTTDTELRIVLLGRTGVGKSATGNSILGCTVFESTSSPSSVTKGCQLGTCTRFDRHIQVLDTPGMYDTEMSIPEITREIVKCVGMTAPGPHAFVLVITPDRFTEEVQNTVDHFMEIFGEGMREYLIILFTRKDDLINDGTTIEKYLAKDSGKLQSFLDSCSNRYLAFNNRGTTAEKGEDLKYLLYLIDEMVRKNKGVYTNEMFQEAEKIMKKREEKLRREHKENEERQRRQIEEACCQQVRAVEESYAEITRQLQMRLDQLESQQGTGRSCQDVANVRKHLQDMRAEHREKIRKIREIGRAETESMRNRRFNYREQARRDIDGDSDFFLKTLLPGLFDVVKIVLPFLLKLIP